MSRVLTAFVAGLVLMTAGAPAAPVAPPPREVVLYYPTTIGTKWTYDSATGASKPFTYIVTRVEKKDESHVVSVGLSGEGGKVAPHRKFEVSARGLFKLETPVYGKTTGPRGPGFGVVGTRELDPSVCLLKLPSVPGEKWEGNPNPGAPAAFTAERRQLVKVPAGQFDAIPVETVQPSSGGKAFWVRYWYAPGVGPVKWSSEATGDVVLTGFWPGKQ